MEVQVPCPFAVQIQLPFSGLEHQVLDASQHGTKVVYLLDLLEFAPQIIRSNWHPAFVRLGAALET